MGGVVLLAVAFSSFCYFFFTQNKGVGLVVAGFPVLFMYFPAI